MDDFQALVLLNMVEGIGSVRCKKLLEVFGKPCDIFKAGLHALTATGILTPLVARNILDAQRRFDVRKEIKEAQQKDIRILTLFDPDYPQILKEIYDPPFVLYMKGELIAADVNAVAIVGSRGASFYGLSCAQRFSSRLSQFGLTIVSGMARGIDTASHRAALDAGGRTIAVLGSGLNKVYPPENTGLFSEIMQRGAVISQFALNTAPNARNFPIRNRIISGLAKGVLVVEASGKSGALITARHALEQGREVFAVPGKLSSETSFGTHELIKQGARLVTEPQEILQELRYNLCVSENIGVRNDGQRKEDLIVSGLSQNESTILEILSDEPKYIDVIAEESGLRVSDIMSILMQLELKGAVKQLPGKTFVKIESKGSSL